MVNCTSNIDSRLSERFAYPSAWILELAEGVWIIEVGLYEPFRMCISIVDSSTYQCRFTNHSVVRSVNKIQIVFFPFFTSRLTTS